MPNMYKIVTSATGFRDRNRDIWKIFEQIRAQDAPMSNDPTIFNKNFHRIYIIV